MRALTRAVHHRRGLGGARPARVGVGLRIRWSVLGRGPTGRSTPSTTPTTPTAFRLAVFVRGLGAELLARRLAQVLPVQVEGVLAGDVAHHGGVGDLAQTINDAKLIAGDLNASNGVIHVIDTVLIPE